ncbi:MAG: Uma2 family endonuclease, partial [Gemmataceae bacterium]|nr:Uma2 family endonuclease [Gemmataceae bacterium]
SSAILLPTSAPPVTPPPRPRVTAPTPRRWTLTEYLNLAKAGLLDGLRTILIAGEILVMPQPGTAHDTALTAAFEFLRTVCPAGHYLRNQQSFNVGTDNDPGPDLAIVPGHFRDYATQAPTVALIVLEVADSSLAKDTTTKAELYATARVPEYWVIDLEHRQLIVFRDPQPLPTGLGATAYRTHATFGPADGVAPLFAPGAPVRVADLLP